MLDGVQLIGTGGLTERLWVRPSLTITGIDAPSVAESANVLTPSARARLSLRIAPGDDAATAQAALVSHLQAHAPWGVQVTVEPGFTAAPYAAPPGGPAYRACTRPWPRRGARPPWTSAWAARSRSSPRTPTIFP